jgi:hypothetical protein
MGMLMAFAPFMTFVVVERIAGTVPALLSAAIVSAGMLVRDWIVRRATPKVLETGTAILFVGLAIIALTTQANWSIPAVRLRVDAGLLLVVLISIIIRKPFTIQYAQEHAAPEVWRKPEFVRVNYVISAVWAAAFVVMVAADLVMVYVPSVPASISVLVTIVALYAAIKFSSRYPESLRVG